VWYPVLRWKLWLFVLFTLLGKQGVTKVAHSATVSSSQAKRRLLHTQASPPTTHPLSSISLTNVPLSWVKSKKLGNCTFKGAPPPNYLTRNKYSSLHPSPYGHCHQTNPPPPNQHHNECQTTSSTRPNYLSLPPSTTLLPPHTSHLRLETINPPCQPTSANTIFLTGLH